MEQLIQEIEHYIKHLTQDYNLRISLHPQYHEHIILDSALRIYNMHRNSYCIFLKSIDGIHNACVNCQKKVANKCKDGSFCGVCHAGVREYVYPISDGSTILGFISVSGYMASDPQKYHQALSERFGISMVLLEENYRSLNPILPDKSQIDTLIHPLQRMLELAYLKGNSDIKPIDFYQKVLLYIKEHHTQDFTSEDICSHFNCSRSYLSHQFKKNCGLSIREYINKLRIDDAKALLMSSELNVTEISIVVGFNDSNYFSKTFKKITGVSPANYRREHS